MWNLFKKNKEIESLKAQINELQKRIKEQNHTIVELTGDRDYWKSQYEEFVITYDSEIEELTGDRDYWKSQYEEFVKTYDSEDATLGKKIKIWTSTKMLHSMESSIELQKLTDRLDYVSQEEAIEILEKAAGNKRKTEILRELGDIILEIMNKD